MYNWIFVSTYKYYSEFKNETPRFSPAAVVTVSQSFIALLVLALLRKFAIWDFSKFKIYTKQINCLTDMTGWMLAVYSYYSKERIVSLFDAFEQLPKWKRKFWAVMSIVFFLLPMILFGFAARK